MKKYKGLVVILDGLGDRPTDVLSGHTPLESANLPTFDRLASRGSVGFMSALESWIPVGTQTGMGMLMGLARADVPQLTRGPVEAAGAGLSLAPGDVALRCNLATIEKSGAGFKLIDRRAGRISEGVEELLRPLDGLSLGDGVTVRIRRSTHHRAVAALVGEHLSDAVTDTDPGAGRASEGVLPCQPRDKTEAAARTASAINRFIEVAYELMGPHPINHERVAIGELPANGLVTRGAGSVFSSRNLITHLGIKTCVVTGEATVVGLARLFGFDLASDPTFDASPTTNVRGKFKAALHALEASDLAILHIKATDVLAHDKDPVGKKKLLEEIDQVLSEFDLDHLVVAVTGDHTTDSNSGRHTGDPVPALVYAPTGRRDHVTAFSESACVGGALGQMTATSFLCCVLDLMNRMHIHQAHEHFLYW